MAFHMEMYFSMHADKHDDSADERRLPGVEMQRSKQFSFSFYRKR